jgi:hypothetical protein
VLCKALASAGLVRQAGQSGLAPPEAHIRNVTRLPMSVRRRPGIGEAQRTHCTCNVCRSGGRRTSYCSAWLSRLPSTELPLPARGAALRPTTHGSSTLRRLTRTATAGTSPLQNTSARRNSLQSTACPAEPAMATATFASRSRSNSSGRPVLCVCLRPFRQTYALCLRLCCGSRAARGRPGAQQIEGTRREARMQHDRSCTPECCVRSASASARFAAVPGVGIHSTATECQRAASSTTPPCGPAVTALACPRRVGRRRWRQQPRQAAAAQADGSGAGVDSRPAWHSVRASSRG